MKKIFIVFVLVVFSGSVFSAGNDMVFQKRNATDTGTGSHVYPKPVSDGFLTYSPVIQDVRWTTLGANLGITSGVLSATFSQVNADWNATSGASLILNKPTIGSAASRDVAPSGDASGAQVVVGSDTRLTNARAPVAHLHNASDIASGVLDDVRIPALAISKVTGLQTALDAKYAKPAGTSSEYVRGDGTLATLPVMSMTINDSPNRSLVTSTTATGFQVSATRNARVCYEGSFSTTSTIGGPSSASVFLETANTNSTTASDWTIRATQTYSNNITLAVVLNQVQSNNWSICRDIPAGKFVRIRSGSIIGTASVTLNAAQQETTF